MRPGRLMMVSVLAFALALAATADAHRLSRARALRKASAVGGSIERVYNGNRHGPGNYVQFISSDTTCGRPARLAHVHALRCALHFTRYYTTDAQHDYQDRCGLRITVRFRTRTSTRLLAVIPDRFTCPHHTYEPEPPPLPADSSLYGPGVALDRG